MAAMQMPTGLCKDDGNAVRLSHREGVFYNPSTKIGELLFGDSAGGRIKWQ
jgi:hypothetical protein